MHKFNCKMKNPTYEDCKNCIYRIRNLCRGKPIKGFATKEGTKRFFMVHKMKDDFIKKISDLYISSFGFGTFRWDLNKSYILHRFSSDLETSIKTFIAEGGNVIDTSPIYLNKLSEYILGKTISQLIYNGIVKRNEIVIIDKYPYFDKNPKEVFQNTLKNINFENIDIYMVHDIERLFMSKYNNPTKIINSLFSWMESLVEMKKIKYYGISIGTHYYYGNGKREDILPYPLENIYNIAERLNGNKNHFKFIEFSLNPINSSALLKKNQKYGSKLLSLLEMSKELNLNVISVEPFARRSIFNDLYNAYNRFFNGLTSPYQKQLNLIRSIRGIDLTIFQSLNPTHIKELMKLKEISKIDSKIAENIFKDVSNRSRKRKTLY